LLRQFIVTACRGKLPTRYSAWITMLSGVLQGKNPGSKPVFGELMMLVRHCA
jgi:hypothetical protein